MDTFEWTNIILYLWGDCPVQNNRQCWCLWTISSNHNVPLNVKLCREFVFTWFCFWRLTSGLHKHLLCFQLGVSLRHKIVNIAIRGFPCESKKKISNKILPPVVIESGTAAIQVWCSPFWATLAFAYKSETLDPALLILTKSSKSGNQVVYEQNRTSTYHVISEREHQT